MNKKGDGKESIHFLKIVFGSGRVPEKFGQGADFSEVPKTP